MEILRKQNERMSKQVQDLHTAKKKLQVPLEKALIDAEEFKKRLQNYEKDKRSLTVIVLNVIIERAFIRSNSFRFVLEHKNSIKDDKERINKFTMGVRRVRITFRKGE